MGHEETYQLMESKPKGAEPEEGDVIVSGYFATERLLWPMTEWRSCFMEMTR